MRKYLDNPASLLKPAISTALALIICWGCILVLAQIKPFWMDEWRILYSLKFKSASSLFGPLYFTQQFPRVYLVVLKVFASAFDYSYFTLRFPAFITGVCSIGLSWKLMNKIYGSERTDRYLFLLIVVASPVFLKYLVQIKQYEMEIFLAIVGIWQLICLAEIGNNGLGNKWKYTVLCISFFMAPFFSYTYPIVAAPIFLLVFIRCIGLWRGTKSLKYSGRTLFFLCFPLFFGAVSILVFYLIDVSGVMRDTAMQCYWKSHMLKGDNLPISFLRNIWGLFGSAGSGDLFQGIFSVLGITAIILAYAKSGRMFAAGKSITELVLHYALLLLSAVILLFIAGKLPLGEPRLNAFTFPALAILIIHLVSRLRSPRTMRLSGILSMILYLGLLGNVLSTIINSFARSSYTRSVRIYSNTEDAIIYAQDHRLPIAISPDIAYPDNIVNEIACLDPIDAASVLKTFPAYKEKYNLQVFSIGNAKLPAEYGLPAGINTGIVGNGTDYKVVKRPFPAR